VLGGAAEGVERGESVRMGWLPSAARWLKGILMTDGSIAARTGSLQSCLEPGVGLSDRVKTRDASASWRFSIGKHTHSEIRTSLVSPLSMRPCTGFADSHLSSAMFSSSSSSEFKARSLKLLSTGALATGSNSPEGVARKTLKFEEPLPPVNVSFTTHSRRRSGFVPEKLAS
jgi:hypothetical protein